MKSLQSLIQTAKSLGLTGGDLHILIKEQQDIEREERLLCREERRMAAETEEKRFPAEEKRLASEERRQEMEYKPASELGDWGLKRLRLQSVSIKLIPQVFSSYFNFGKI